MEGSTLTKRTKDVLTKLTLELMENLLLLLPMGEGGGLIYSMFTIFVITHFCRMFPISADTSDLLSVHFSQIITFDRILLTLRANVVCCVVNPQQ